MKVGAVVRDTEYYRGGHLETPNRVRQHGHGQLALTTASVNLMHPRIQEILDHLDGQRSSLREAIESVPSALHCRRPVPERWSAAEIVDHLGIVETNITLLLNDRLNAARAAGIGPEHDATSVLPTLDVKKVLDRTLPRVARDAVQPHAGVDMPTAWESLERSRQRLREVVVAADGLALSEVHAPHPAFGTLNLYQWLIFVGAHEGRHAMQIREVAAALAV